MRIKNRWLRRLTKGLLGVVAVLALALAVIYLLARPSLGRDPEGVRLARIKQSPQWVGDAFSSGRRPWSGDVLGGGAAPTSTPPSPVPVVKTDPRQLQRIPASGLRVTWFGHSSTLVQIDGVNVLTDPFWSERPTPLAGVGPKRWYPPPIALAQLPRIDAVVVSHDHYDHMDRATLQALNREGIRFVVPLGLGAHLEAWGVPASRIVELDWWESTSVGGVRIHATPARHFSGRLVPRSDRTLWAGFAMVGPRNRLYYTGDTAYMPEMERIGERLGPFDLAMTDSGQYDASWTDVHMGPEQAVYLAKAVQARAMMPIHWGLIRLAYHSWQEPAERTLAAAVCHPIRVLIPPPGQPIEPASSAAVTRWWPRLAWATAAQAPVQSTVDGDGSARFDVGRCATGRYARVTAVAASRG